MRTRNEIKTLHASRHKKENCVASWDGHFLLRQPGPSPQPHYSLQMSPPISERIHGCCLARRARPVEQALSLLRVPLAPGRSVPGGAIQCGGGATAAFCHLCRCVCSLACMHMRHRERASKHDRFCNDRKQMVRVARTGVQWPGPARVDSARS